MHAYTHTNARAHVHTLTRTISFALCLAHAVSLVQTHREKWEVTIEVARNKEV